MNQNEARQMVAGLSDRELEEVASAIEKERRAREEQALRMVREALVVGFAA